MGSQSVGTNTPESDTDYMEVVLAGEDVYLGMDYWGSQGTKERKTTDEQGKVVEATAYELTKFLRLCSGFNPNVIPLLWLKPEHYLILESAGKLIIENRHLFNSKVAVFSFCGYAHNQLKKMGTDGAATGRMGAKRKDLRDKFGYDCYEDASTEFLTNNGWKKWDDVNSVDGLATININTWETEFQQYTERYEKLYAGPMFDFNYSNFKASVTVNHHMLVSPARRSPDNNWDITYDAAKADWKLVPVSALLYDSANVWGRKRSYLHYRRAPEFKNNLSIFGQEHPDWEIILRLAGFYLSDGCAVFQPTGAIKSVKFTQTKFGNYFQEFLDELTILPAFEANHINRYFYNKEHIWHLYGPLAKWLVESFGYTDSKCLPSWALTLSKQELDALWSGLMAGDGHQYDKFDIYYTASKPLADSIQASFVTGGYVVGVNGPYQTETGFGSCEMYQVRKSQFQDKHGVIITSRTSENGYDSIKIREVENARVVCFSVPNGTLITRNHGKISIHGNTKYLYHTIRLGRMLVEFLACEGVRLNVWRKDIDAEELLKIRNGALTYEEGLAYATKLLERAEELAKTSLLPAAPDKVGIRQLCKKILREHLLAGAYLPDQTVNIL